MLDRHLIFRSRSRSHVYLLAVAFSGAAFVACSATSGNEDGGDDDDGNGGAGGSGGTAAGGNLLTGSSTGTSMVSPDCSDAAQLIYLIGDDNRFYSFYPPTLAIEELGTLSCPQGGGFATPFSMAVDRDGIAWVLFSDGRIYHVDVETVACSATSFATGQEGFFTFGMGFVSDAAGSEEETLFVADYNGSGIASIDPATLDLNFVGAYDALAGAPAELTGTGDARLYGFFLGTPVVVAEIDRATGSILSQAPQPSINIGNGWAFAFWGGDFYLFTNPSGVSSRIDRYSPSTQQTTIVVPSVGSNIVGAGVSTCAPLEPPS